MNAAKHPRMTGIVLTALLAALAIGVAGTAGCSREQEPPAPTALELPTPTGAVPEPDVPESVGALAMAAMLGYAPEQTALAMAIPSADEVERRLMKLAARFVDDEADLEGAFAGAVAGLRGSEDETAPRSLAELLRAEGIDPSRPAALFMGVEALVASIEEATQAIEAERAEMEEDDAEESPEGAEDAEASDDEMLLLRLMAEQKMSAPEWAAVVHVADEEAFVRMLIEEAGKKSDEPLPDPVEVAANGRTIVSYGERDALNYFLFDGRACVGYSLAFVQQAAQRAAAPAEVSYGSADMPASPDDLLVASARMDKLTSLLSAAMALFASVETEPDPSTTAAAMLMREAYGADPVVATLSAGERHIEMLTRLDYSKHPEFPKTMGEAAPLRLARVFPAETAALIALRLTPEHKQQIKELWLDSLFAESEQSPQMYQTMMFVRPLIDLLGEEIALGVSGFQRMEIPLLGGEQPVPALTLMIDLLEPQTLKGLLMFVPALPADPHRDIEIKKAPLPLPVDLQYAFADSVVVAATSREGLTQAIDGLLDGGDGGFLASLEPPLDPEADRYSVVALKEGLFAELMGMAGTDLGAPGMMEMQGGEAQTLFKALAQVESLVSVQEVVDNMLHGRLTLRLTEQGTVAAD